MRKWLISGIGAFVVVCLLAFFLVMPYFIGQSLEGYVTNKAAVQKLLMQGQRIESIQYDRGWFSSKVKAVFSIETNSIVGQLLLGNKVTSHNKPLEVVVKADIQHGPLLIGVNNRGSMYFKFGRAHVDLSEELTPATQQAMKQAGLIMQLVTSTSAFKVGFGDTFSGSSMVAPIKLQEHLTLGSAAISQFTLNWDAALSTSSISYDMTSSDISIDSNGTHIKVKPVTLRYAAPIPFDFSKLSWEIGVKGLTLQHNGKTVLQVTDVNLVHNKKKMSVDFKNFVINKDDQQLSISSFSGARHYWGGDWDWLRGESVLKVPSIAFKDKNTQWSVKDIELGGKTKVDDKFASDNATLQIKQITYNNYSFGPLKVKTSVSKLSVAALKQYNKLMNESWMGLFSMLKTEQPSFSRQQFAIAEQKIKLIRLRYKMLEVFPQIFNQGAQYHWDPLTLEFPKGKFTMTLAVSSPNMPDAKNISQLMMASKLDMQLQVTKVLVQKALIHLRSLQNGVSNNKQAIKKQVDDELAKAVKDKALLDKGGDYQLNLNYEKGHLAINGQMATPGHTPQAVKPMNLQRPQVDVTTSTTSTSTTPAANQGANGAAAKSQDKDSVAGTESKDKDTAAAAESKDKDSAVATEKKDKDGVAATEGKDKDTGAATESQDKDSAAATESKDKDTGATTKASAEEPAGTTQQTEIDANKKPVEAAQTDADAKKSMTEETSPSDKKAQPE